MTTPERSEGLLPAPGRGQYDRALTRERRQAEQRERLLVATAAALAKGQATVQGVIALAGVGRNTFYEYFDDFPHALAAVRARAEARVELECRSHVEQARTTIERFRAIGRGWCGALLVSPTEARVLLGAEGRGPEQPLSSAGRILASAYESAWSASSRSTAQDRALIIAAAAAGEVLLLRALGAPGELDPAVLVAQVAIRLLH